MSEQGAGRPFIESADCSRTPRTAIKNLVLGFRPSSIAVRHSYTGVRLPPYRPQGGGGGASAELGSSAPVPGSIALWSDIVR